MKVRTIPQIVAEIRSHDPESAVNEYMLMEWIRQGVLPYDKHGNRTVADYDTAVQTMKDLLGLEEVDVPRLRTVRSAAYELRGKGFGEDKIRAMLADGKLDSIHIGNRSYIALEQFERPYADRFFRRNETDISARTSTKRRTTEQVGHFLSTHTGVPTVKRVREREAK